MKNKKYRDFGIYGIGLKRSLYSYLASMKPPVFNKAVQWFTGMILGSDGKYYQEDGVGERTGLRDGGVAVFDGTREVQVSMNSGLYPSIKFTIDGTIGINVFSRGIGTQPTDIVIGMSGTGLRFFYYDTNGSPKILTVLNYNTVYGTGKHEIEYLLTDMGSDTTKAEIFIDGELHLSSTNLNSIPSYNGDTHYIGSRVGGGLGYCNMEDMTICDSDDKQIFKTYFENTDSETVFDISDEENHGTLTTGSAEGFQIKKAGIYSYFDNFGGNIIGFNPNVVVNGNFEDGTNGYDVVQPGWTVVDNKAVSGGVLANQYIRQDGAFTTGEQYLVSIKIDENEQGDLNVYIGASNPIVIPEGFTGIYEIEHTSTGTDFFLNAQADGQGRYFKGSVDYVDIKKLPLVTNKVPALESNPTVDVLGNPNENQGRVKYNAEMHSSCLSMASDGYFMAENIINLEEDEDYKIDFRLSLSGVGVDYELPIFLGGEIYIFTKRGGNIQAIITYNDNSTILLNTGVVAPRDGTVISGYLEKAGSTLTLNAFGVNHSIPLTKPTKAIVNGDLDVCGSSSSATWMEGEFYSFDIPGQFKTDFSEFGGTVITNQYEDGEIPLELASGTNDWTLSDNSKPKNNMDGYFEGLVCTSTGTSYQESNRTYGTWELNLSKGSTSDSNYYFISDVNSLSSVNGYCIATNASGQIGLLKFVDGVAEVLFLTGTGYINSKIHYRIKIVRSESDDKFSVGIKGGSFGDEYQFVGSLFEDSPISTSNYQILDLVVNDEVSYVKDNDSQVHISDSGELTEKFVATNLINNVEYLDYDGHSAFAELKFEYSGTELEVSALSTIGFNQSKLVVYVDGVVNQEILYAYGVEETKFITLPAGDKEICITEEWSTKPSTVIGQTSITSVKADSSFKNIVEGPVAEKVVFLGDSITVGDRTATSTIQAYSRLFHTDDNANVAVLGFGYGQLKEFASTTTLLDHTIGYYTELFKNTTTKKCVISMGTNDYGLSSTPSATFIGWYEDLVDRLVAYDSNIEIFCVAPIDRQGEGQLLQDYRDAMQVLCTANANCTYVDTQGMLTYPEDYNDGIHPNTQGHQKYHDHIAPIILGE